MTYISTRAHTSQTMDDRQLETALDASTTTSRRDWNSTATAADEYDSDNIIDPANEHRDDPANTTNACADHDQDSTSEKPKRHRTSQKKYSNGGGSGRSKRAAGTNADLNYRDRYPGTDQGDDEDRHREAIFLY